MEIVIRKQKVRAVQFTDEQQKYIDEHYQLLPLDADGVPIHVGDAITLPNGSRDKVRFITIREHDTVFNERGWVPSQCTHVKPRTLEDVLIDAMQFGFSSHAGDNVMDKAREFADEIRELLGGDA